MLRDTLTKFNIKKDNLHLENIYKANYFLELGTIDHNILIRLLNYEMVTLEDIAYFKIQNQGIGASLVKDEELANILPYVFFENYNRKNKNAQLFITYGMLGLKTNKFKDVFSPLVMIPINIYFENDKIFFQQISRPTENPILLDFLKKEKNIEVPLFEKLDNVYQIDKYCSSFLKYPGLNVEFENFLTFATLREPEVRIDNDKFNAPKEFDSYLYERLFNSNNDHFYYIKSLNRIQRYAVHTAGKGNNLVISGRLGTGKTTTLVNIAINAIKDKKRVLYLSNMKESLDSIHSFFEEKGISKYLSNFSNSFSSFNQGELHINKEEVDEEEIQLNIIENYNYIDDQVHGYTGRIFDYRFIDIINDLSVIKKEDRILLDIGEVSHLYKGEYRNVLNSLKNISKVLTRGVDFKRSLWKDIPVINIIKYPNQVLSLVYQVKKSYSVFEEERIILENDFGVKDISNYAYLKNIIHDIKALNPNLVPESWKSLENFEEARLEFQNLKTMIYQVQEIDYILKTRYSKIDEVDIEEELKKILANKFKQSDSEEINKLLENRVEVLVNVNKLILNYEIFKKTFNKISGLMKWDFIKSDDLYSDLDKLSDVLQKCKLNSKILRIVTSVDYTLEYAKVLKVKEEIDRLKEEVNGLFKLDNKDENFDAEVKVSNFEKFDSNQKLKKSAYKVLSNIKKTRQEVYVNLKNDVSSYRILKLKISKLEENFFDLTDYDVNTNVLEDIDDLKQYLDSINCKISKSKIIKFLKKLISQKEEGEKLSKNYLNAFENYSKAYRRINSLMAYLEDYYIFRIFDEASDFDSKRIKFEKFYSYLKNLYQSNDLLSEHKIQTVVTYSPIEEYFELSSYFKKYYSKKELLNNNKRYQLIYGNLYDGLKTNVNDLSRFIQSFKFFYESFNSYEDVKKALVLENNNKINEHLNNCSIASDKLIESFKLYFKIFKSGVSKYYYSSITSILDELDQLLLSKDDLINYLSVTDNFRVLSSYGLNKLIDYIVSIEDTSKLSENFKYTYLSKLIDLYIKGRPNLLDHETLDSKIKETIEMENILIKHIEKETFNNIKDTSGNKFSVYGIRNLDYKTYVRRTKGVKHIFLSTTQILNNYLDILDFDLVIIDDANLLSANDYHQAILGSQVVIAGEEQLLSLVANNLISRMSSSKSLVFNYRFTKSPKNLLIQMPGLHGPVYKNYIDNFGVEIINNNILEYISLLYLENPNFSINLFIASFTKQKQVFEKLSDIFLKNGMKKEEIVEIFQNKLNVSDLSLGYLYNADYNIIDLEDYYHFDTDYIVINLIDNLLLCKKKLIVFDSKDYLKSNSGSRFLEEISKVVSKKDTFKPMVSTDVLGEFVRRLEDAKIEVFHSSIYSLIIKYKNNLFGIVLYWNSGKTNFDIINSYRNSLQNPEEEIKIFVLWSVELVNSLDTVIERIIEEVTK